MAGKVREWWADAYDPSADRGKGPLLNPRGPDAAPQRVVRGGCQRDPAPSLRTSLRAGADRCTGGDFAPYIGFRCVLLLGEKHGAK
ncbi:MAG: SUMF1/EgtB/PvdO family nonheme iron enzyme [Planctomycetes bacterium]|nr:SUMF1/EgtB/PvdO family nonheme iron enzyme [Planctomycetota bacterium]